MNNIKDYAKRWNKQLLKSENTLAQKYIPNDGLNIKRRKPDALLD
jgi:hypothetical protein